MVILKMQKFNIITFSTYYETVMENLQDFQNIELFPAEHFFTETSTLFNRMKNHPRESEIEAHINELDWSRNFLNQYIPKKGMIANLRQPIERYTIKQLAQHMNDYDWEETCKKLKYFDKRLRVIDQERRELALQEADLNEWRYFDEEPKKLEKLHQTVGLLGTIPSGELTHLTQEIGIIPYTYMETIHHTATTAYVLILAHKDSQSKVRTHLKKVGFEDYYYPLDGKPADDLLGLKEKTQRLVEEEETIKAELKTMEKDYTQLGLVAEYFDGLLIRVKSNQYMLESKYTMSVSGWVPAKDADQLIHKVESAAGEDYYIEFQEVKEEEVADVPILLRNNAFVKPFESLVEMYSLPQYDELDPTPLMTPFYALAFGMMVADFGYGLLLFFAIFIAKRFFHFKEGMRQSLSFFQVGALATVLWGLIYGNFFGNELSFQLLSGSTDITEILVVSVAFGYMQLMFGLFLKFYVQWKMRDNKAKAIFQAGSWILFLISVVVIVLAMMILNNPGLQTIGVGGIIVSLVMVVIGSSLDGETIGGKIGWGLYGLMDITSYLGDLVSYTRLMALGVAGGSIAAAFNLIISYLPTPAKFTVGILLFIVLHGLNIFLSYLSAYVHGIRLQYLEFFGKFYTGGGRAFKPMKSNEKYVEVISEQEEIQGGKS